MTKPLKKYAFVLSAAVLIPLVSAQQSAAKGLTLKTKFKISFLGLNVGVMKNNIHIDGNTYSISGGVRSNSLVSVVADTKANFSSSGTIRNNRLVPSSHNTNFHTPKKKGYLKLGYANANISTIAASPAIKYKPGTIPLKKAHTQNVLDPLSPILFPVNSGDVGNGRAICNRTLPVFDGRTRMNLVFSYKSKAKSRAKGFSGPVYKCAVRYQPVSGFRPFKKNIKFMKANRDIEVTLARVGNTNLYSLFSFRVRTDKGTASGKAYHFAIE